MKINTTVKNVEQAQQLIAELLTQFAAPTAYDRLMSDARQARQSVEEEAYRTSGNLLTSFVTRKPGGFVVLVTE